MRESIGKGLALGALIMMIPLQALAEAAGEGMQPYTWESLSTLAGATAATLMIVEFVKTPLDRVWYIPTRLLVYLVAAAILMMARAFLGGLTAQGVILTLVDAVLVALSAYGSYELTFANQKTKQKS